MKAARKTKRVAKSKNAVWELRLYVADTSARSLLATGNLQSLCEQYLHGQYRLTIVDIIKEPLLASQDEILATPTLVRINPGPQRRLIGSLSDTPRVLKALELDAGGTRLTSLFPASALPIGQA